MSKFTLPTIKTQGAAPVAAEVDPAALQAFADGAKDKSLELGGAAPPWAAFDPGDAPKYNVSVRLNDYHLEMLRYLAGAQDTSQQRVLRKQLIPLLEQLAEAAFEEGKVKSE
jgi:hypothetical protein